MQQESTLPQPHNDARSPSASRSSRPSHLTDSLIANAPQSSYSSVAVQSEQPKYLHEPSTSSTLDPSSSISKRQGLSLSTRKPKSPSQKHASTQTLDNRILRSTSDAEVQVTMNVNASPVNRLEPPKRVSVANALGWSLFLQHVLTR